MNGKVIRALCVGLLIGALLTAALIRSFSGREMPMLRSKEPLLIESQFGEVDYVLPAGTVLYHDRSFPEGHDRYIVYFNHKGVIDHEEVPMKPEYGGTFIDPLWLSNIDADVLEAIFRRFPLSRADVQAVIEANGITRDDLADIIRSLPQ